jgi:DNA-binding GntR family transcriptional regulator
MVETATTIADQVFAEIRRAIVEGDIPQGSKISEPELARRFGISRGPLREAMRRLESSNLVERRPNVGARVITLSNEQLIEIFHVREALEGMAARLAARHMSDDEIADLRALVLDHQRQAERDDGKAYMQREGDLDFHYRIVEGSHNRRLKGLLCNDLYHLVRMYRFQFGTASPRARRAMGEHSHIVEAIEGGDGELAEILMRRHIRASRKNLERRLSEEGSMQHDRLSAGPEIALA